MNSRNLEDEQPLHKKTTSSAIFFVLGSSQVNEIFYVAHIVGSCRNQRKPLNPISMFSMFSLGVLSWTCFTFRGKTGNFKSPGRIWACPSYGSWPSMTSPVSPRARNRKATSSRFFQESMRGYKSTPKGMPSHLLVEQRHFCAWINLPRSEQTCHNSPYTQYLHN